MATGKQTFDNTIYGSSGGGGGSNNNGPVMGGPSQLVRKLNLRSKGRSKTRRKRK